MAQKLTDLAVPAYPCPYCLGNKLRVSSEKHDGMEVNSIVCLGCFANGPVSQDAEGAVEKWNNRAIPKKMQEALEELEQRRAGTWKS